MRYVIGFCLAVILAAESAPAASKPDPVFLAEKNRTVEGERDVLVELPQTEIEAEIELGRIAANGNGGLLGALIISAQDNRRKTMASNATQRAEATVAPLRKALDGFDIASLAADTTKSALAQPGWFAAGKFAFDTTIDRRGFASAAAGPQVAIVTYSYGLSPDFTQIRVIAEVVVGRKTKSAGGVEVLFRQDISSVAELRKRSYEHADNVETWSVDDGDLAKASLAAAFGRMEKLIPFALDLTQAQVKALDAKTAPKAFAAGFYGGVVKLPAAVPGDTIIWDDRLIDVFPVGDGN